jgi:DNA-binding transcriptional ArsR family regulator
METSDNVLTPEALELVAARFRVLSEPSRLRILHTLGRSEMSVGDLVEATNASQANTSKHLGMLLDAGIVARRKDGLNAYYRVADESIFELCELVCSRLSEQLAARHVAVSRFAGRTGSETPSK